MKTIIKKTNREDLGNLYHGSSLAIEGFETTKVFLLKEQTCFRFLQGKSIEKKEEIVHTF